MTWDDILPPISLGGAEFQRFKDLKMLVGKLSSFSRHCLAWKLCQLSV